MRSHSAFTVLFAIAVLALLVRATQTHRSSPLLLLPESLTVFLAASKLPVLARALPKVLDNVKTVVFWGPVDANAEQGLKVGLIA